MPPLRIQSPTLVHHMAALDDQLAPPNSLEAVQVCLDAEAAIIEVDITALVESDYLLVHEPNLQAETSGRGRVAECTPAQARQLFIKWRKSITEYRAALLSEVVQLIENAHGRSRLQLDFKNEIPFSNDEPLRRLILLIEPLGERVIVSSGADWQLRRLRKLAPWLILGFDIMHYIDSPPAHQPRDPRVFPKQRGAYGYYDDHMLATGRYWSAAEYLHDRCESLIGLVPDVSAFYVEHTLLTHSLKDEFNWAEVLHQRGIKLDAWTIDATNPVTAATAPRLLAAGVDMFTTNTPHALARLFDKQIA